MSRIDHPIQDVLVDALGLAPGQVMVDLGCGQGGSLAAAAHRVAGLRLVGLDANEAALQSAEETLSDTGAELHVADLTRRLPFDDASVDAVACHNVLECLPAPAALINEASRILRPGGRAVWSHVDFDGLIIHTSDVDLDRRVLHAYADHAQGWMQQADGRMGRALPGLIARSPLTTTATNVHMLTADDLEGDARRRVDEIAEALGDGTPTVSADEVSRWRHGIDDLAEQQAFFYAEPTIVVSSQRPI